MAESEEGSQFPLHPQEEKRQRENIKESRRAGGPTDAYNGKINIFVTHSLLRIYVLKMNAPANVFVSS